MKTIIKIDPRSIRENKAYGQDCVAIYGRPQAEEVRVTQKGNLYRMETWRGTKVEQGRLVDGILTQVLECTGGPPGKSSIRVEQPVQYLQSFHSEPRFKYDYLPTLVVCKNCMEMFYHTELKSDFNDWDYGEGCASERCDTICPWCRTWYCCEIEYEKLTDAELEKRRSEGINQVAIEEIVPDKETHEK